jgi:hypothetical protein
MARRSQAWRAIPVAALAACSAGPFFIGEQEGGSPNPRCADASCEGRLEIAFDRSGTSAWENPRARWILRGEAATDTRWPIEGGGELGPRAAPIVGLDTPFTDSTRAVSTAFEAADPALAALGSGDVMLEAVFRAAPGALYRKGDLSLAAGETLRLSAGGASVESEPLVPGAWYHCAFLLRRGVDTAVVCNGRALRTGAIAATDFDTGATAVVADGSAHVAWLAAFDLDPATTTDSIRARFLALTGALPEIAGGTSLPLNGVRDSPAFVDLVRGSARRLHLVGPDWPRLACRSDGAIVCGYLAEPARFRRIPWRAREWHASAATVAADAFPFATDLFGMDALIADASSDAHELSHDEGPGDSRQVFSLFARAGSMSLLRVRIEGRASVLFDLAAAAIAEDDPRAYASVEPWGDGIVRLSIIVDGSGERRFAIAPENAAGTAFAGDGSAQVYLTGFQLEVNAGFATQLLGSDEQASDELSFIGDDGNLPTERAGAIAVELFAPSEPRIHDGALVNLNRNASFDEQVNLFVTHEGHVLFWGLSDGASRWSFGSGESALGRRALVRARWTDTIAELEVGGERSAHDLSATLGDASFDRADIGFSSVSSAPLQGLLHHLRIGQ